MVVEKTDKMGGRGETALIGNGFDLGIGGQQQRAGPREPFAHQPTVGRNAIELLEVCLELREAHITPRCEGREGLITTEILADVVFKIGARGCP